MYVSHESKYRKIIELAEKAGATSVSFQHHTFVNFDTRDAAESFYKAASSSGLEPWEINTDRPYVPFEVIINRW